MTRPNGEVCAYIPSPILPHAHRAEEETKPSFRKVSRSLASRAQTLVPPSPQAYPEFEHYLILMILSYQFSKIPSFQNSTSRQLPLKTLALWSYALGEKGERDGEALILRRLCQRLADDDREVGLLQTLCAKREESLGNLAQELLRDTPWLDEPHLKSFFKIQIADRLIEKKNFLDAIKLMESFETMPCLSEWHAMQRVKFYALQYLTFSSPLTTLIEKLENSSFDLVKGSSFLLAEVQRLLLVDYLNQVKNPDYKIKYQKIRRLITSLSESDPIWQERLMECLVFLDHSLIKRIWQLAPNPSGRPWRLNPVAGRGFDVSCLWLRSTEEKIQMIESWSQRHHYPEALSEARHFSMNEQTLWCHRILYQSQLLKLEQPSQTTCLNVEDELLSFEPAACERLWLDILDAANAYRRGNFSQCLLCLRRAQNEKPDLQIQDALQLWLSTGAGNTYSSISPESYEYAQRLGRLFFHPTLNPCGDGKFTISSFYSVDLTKNPVLNRLLLALLHQSDSNLSLEKIQDQVWGQGPSLEGWKQKIRNAVRRARKEFRFTLLPLFDQIEGKLQLNHRGIIISPAALTITQERLRDVTRTLSRQSLSSRQVSAKTKVPLATVKRLLAQLSSDEYLHVLRKGRSIVYRWAGPT